jgi:DnaJ-domain-containing protein 1
VTLKDASFIFEKTIVSICREGRMQRRFTPADIDLIIRAVTTEDVAAVIEEYASYIEREDWDALVQLAAQERTMRMLRGGV